MELDHQTERDTTLTHQVIFEKHADATDIAVSCNCRATRTHGGHSSIVYKPMGYTKTLDESRALYNDPNNHWKFFRREDEAKW